MSVGIATMGMFNPCCGTKGGGGAPPYRPNDEPVKPMILVRSVEVTTIKKNYDLIKNVKAKLIDKE